MGARALRLFAAGVCRSSKVGLIDMVREVVGGNAVGSLSASRTGAHNVCGCWAYRPLSIRPGKVFRSCGPQTIWSRDRSIIDRTMSSILLPSTPSVPRTCLRSPDSTSHNRREGRKVVVTHWKIGTSVKHRLFKIVRPGGVHKRFAYLLIPSALIL